MRTAAAAFGGYFVAKWTIGFDDALQKFVLQFLTQIIPHVVIYYVMLKLASKIRISYIFGISMIFTLLAYLAFFLLAYAGSALYANIVYGFLSGLAGGTYWCSYNNIVLNNIREGTRRKYLSVNGAGTLAFSVGAPAVMSVIVLIFGQTVNIPPIVYNVFFGAAAAFILAAGIIAFTIRLEKYPVPFKLKGKFFSRADKEWNSMLLYSYFSGAVSGVSGSIAIIFLMMFAAYSQSVYLIALSASILVSSLASYLFKSLKLKNRTFYILIIALEAAVYIAAGFVYGVTIPLIFCILFMLVKTVTENLRLPLEIICHTKLITKYKAAESNISARYFVRELFIIAGRFTSAAAILTAGIFIAEKSRILLAAFLGFVLANIPAVIFYLKLKDVPAEAGASVINTNDAPNVLTADNVREDV
jgi:MFS family permease